MTDPFSSLRPWRIFLRVADCGSVSRAALELDADAAYVSRTVASLERDLGVRLLDRSVRPMAPTPEGRAVLSRLRPLLAQWDGFERFALSPEGGRRMIRLSTPVGIGRFYLNRQIAEYAEAVPDVTIEASVNAGAGDVLAGRVDVAFLPCIPREPGLAVYPAMTGFTMPLAAPRYIARRGLPRSPEELVSHTGIVKCGEGFPASDHLVRGTKRRLVFWKHMVRHTDMLNIKDAVVKGYGITLDLPLGMALEEIRSGGLVQVLSGWHRDFWYYSVVTREADDADSPVGRFAAWYARRATREIEERRRRGFELLGLDESKL